MNRTDDQELLDLIAKKAPTPDPAGLADRLLATARKARVRRRVGFTLASAVVTSSIVVGTAVAFSTSDGESNPGPAVTTPSTIDGQEPVDVRPSVASTAAAIHELATEMEISEQPWPVLYVRDHTCSDVVEPGASTACGDGEPVPLDVQRELAEALELYAPVEFVADPDTVWPDDRHAVAKGGVLVTLGPPQEPTKGTAEVSLSIQAGRLHGQGLTYRLERTDGEWEVAKTVGLRWIS